MGPPPEADDLPYRKPHILRHTFASLLLEAGESPAYVKDQCGHHSIKITVDLYGHLIPGADQVAVNRLDDPRLDGAPAPICTLDPYRPSDAKPPGGAK